MNRRTRFFDPSTIRVKPPMRTFRVGAGDSIIFLKKPPKTDVREAWLPVRLERPFVLWRSGAVVTETRVLSADRWTEGYYQIFDNKPQPTFIRRTRAGNWQMLVKVV